MDCIAKSEPIPDDPASAQFLPQVQASCRCSLVSRTIVPPRERTQDGAVRLPGTLLRPTAVAVCAFGLMAALGAFAASGDTVADRVLGQSGSFTATTCNSGGVSASSLCEPGAAASDAAGRLYIADAGNNRVLQFDSPLTSQTATRVFGQPNFTSNSVNNCGCSVPNASSLSVPSDVAVDSSGRLYVADFGNHRVLEYDSPLTSQTANRVFGQGGSFTTATCTAPSVSASSMCYAGNVAVDSGGRLYVADADENRVLEFDSPLSSQVATKVIGQGGSFTTGDCNAGGRNAATLCTPQGLALDSGGRLFISDSGNNRVLEYDSPLTSQTANRVFGQGGSFSAGSANNGGVTGGSLAFPVGLRVDFGSALYVADDANNRVLKYDHPLTSQVAARVFGQGDNFTTTSCGAASATTMCNPRGLAPDNADNLYVVDGAFNNRALEYDGVGSVPSVGGIAEPPDVNTLPMWNTTSSNAIRSFEFVLAVVGLVLIAAFGWYAAGRSHR